MRRKDKRKTIEKEAAIRKKIQRYISENIKNASIEELSKILGYSNVYTGKLVKALSGMTFKKYLQSYRLAMASRMLRSSSKKIGEIIFECGYENESFFRRIFKKEFGVTPLVYRRENFRQKKLKK